MAVAITVEFSFQKVLNQVEVGRAVGEDNQRRENGVPTLSISA